MQLNEKVKENEELRAQIKKMASVIESYRKIVSEQIQAENN